MKKVNCFLLISLLSVFIFGLVEAKNNRHTKVKNGKHAKVQDVVSPYKIWRTNTAPVIDGKMDKIWCSIPWIPITHYTIVGNATPDSEDNAGLTKAMWDDNNLYLLFYNEAPVIYDNPANAVWNQTAVEVYIGATDSKASAYTATDYQIAFPHWMQGQESANVLNIDEAGGMPTAGVQFAITTDYSDATDSTAGLGGWWLELKIPLSDLSISPVAGTVIGWDLQQDIVEDPTTTARQYQSNWWDTDNTGWKETDVWGEAILSPDINIGKAKIFKTAIAPTIDGVKDAVYAQSEDQSADYWRSVDGTSSDCPNPTDANIVASALWDATNLYLFFDVNDNNITDIPINPNWNQSDVELYLGPNDKANPYGSADRQIQIPHWMKGQETGKLGSISYNPFFDTTGCVFKILDRADGSGYSVEVQIPWNSLNLGLTIAEGTTIGYLFGMDYSSNGTARTGAAQWWDNTNGCWNNAGLWGEAVLEKGGSTSFPPTVNTNAATSVTSSSAVLNATVNPNGLATTAYFEWGTDNALSSPTATTTQSIGSGTSNQTITASLTGLNTNTTYYYRVVAQNSVGTQRGSILSFTTSKNISTNIPTIASFSPTSGPIGTTVTITGTNFDPTASNIIVYFGAVRATVTSASSTSLTVTVPTGATYQPITVTNVTTGLTAFSSKPFVVTFPSSRIIDATSFAPKLDFTTGSFPHGVAICDVDGDGKPDVIVVNSNDNTVSIFRNTSASGSITANSFAPKVDFATGSSPDFIATGDVDGDGKPDLVITNVNSNTVSVFRNTSTSGSIAFAPKVDFSSTNPGGVVICDIDGDGKPDIIVANASNNSLSVFRNTSTSGTITTSSFAPKIDFTTGSNPSDIVAGDMDGDGKPDLIVANTYNNTVSVFRNTSTSGSITASSFALKVDITVGSNPWGLTIGDVDGDGKLDIVVANYVSNTISVIRNTCVSGSITPSSFASKVDFTTGTNPQEVAITDVDGDSKSDIVVINNNSNSISVFKNTSTSGSITPSSFASKVDFTTGSAPTNGIAIGDVDGDGKPDIVITNSNSNTVSVFRNTIGGSNTAPASPQNLSASTGDGQVILKWNKNTEADFLKYRIYRGITSGGETLMDSTSASITDTTKTISGLTNGTMYYFKITAMNTARLESGYSNEVSATPTAGSVNLPTVTTNSATSVTSTTATLNAIINPNSSGTTAYFEWGTDNTLTTVSVTPSQSIGSGTSNQIFTAGITGLSPNTTYYYHAVAQNSSGTQRGTIVSFLTTPAAVTLTTPSDGATNQLLTLKLIWSQSAGAAKYHLQVSTDQGFNSTIINDTTITAVSTEINKLTFATTYYWRVSAMNSGGEGPLSSTSHFTTIPTPPTTIAVSKTYNYPQKSDVSNYAKTDYQIIGLPGSSNQPITKFLGGTEKSDWEAYWDDGGTDNYDIKYDGSSNFTFTAGKAFWVISKNTINVNATIQVATMNSNYEVEIPLHSGWNLITNPYPASMSWSNVENTNGISSVIYGYNGGSYSQSPKFDPYMGYYFFNGTPNTILSTLRVPYQSIYANVINTESLAKNDWRVNVQLQSAGIVDKSVSFGVSRAASAGLNKYNFRKPRALAGVPEIHFNRTDWDSDFPAFAANIRPSIGEVERWQLSVNGKQGASAKLVFGGINEVPASCAVFLVDSVHAMFADLRKDSVYEFTQPRNSTSMTILVGSPEKVEKEAQSVLPVSYELSRNFPNPFNPSTNFLVRLPAASPACRTGRQVTIRVYNILGQMVREIYHGNLDVGQHWFTWDGRNQNQQKMPSGVYYCRLEVSGKLSQSIKMVLMN